MKIDTVFLTFNSFFFLICCCFPFPPPHFYGAAGLERTDLIFPLARVAGNWGESRWAGIGGGAAIER